MLPPKFHDIVASCHTVEQLDTCRHFADYLWGNYSEHHTLAYAVIQQRECQLMRSAAPEGRQYSPVTGNDPFTETSPHTQD